eukprot:4561653-Pyramimonas_sp.AAC.1
MDGRPTPHNYNGESLLLVAAPKCQITHFSSLTSACAVHPITTFTTYSEPCKSVPGKAKALSTRSAGPGS